MQRDIKQWKNWLLQPLGKRLIDSERQFLPHLLSDCYGKYALLIGVPQQSSLLKFSAIPCQILLSPAPDQNKNMSSVEGNFYKLPFIDASLDVVLIPHCLELLDNPRQLIMEACRITKPGGHIIIFGFNPFSLWGLKRRITNHSTLPWSGNFLPPSKVRCWLNEAQFELIKQETLFFRPPFDIYNKLYKNIHFMEWFGRKLWSPFGGIYMLMAKAKMIPLTPIKLQWQQPIADTPVSVPGPSIRNSP